MVRNKELAALALACAVIAALSAVGGLPSPGGRLPVSGLFAALGG